ncbi:Transcriptional regulator, LysR family [plant metagenome]|uniref:Transcriptional regulator, LysR family n=1 Tax=plant metagenome TaxID=1297885 RepID=A0A484VJ96_9ZZZZ
MKRPNGKSIPSVTNLAAFDAVARAGTMTAAARALSLTQSAVSKQVAELQAFLGVPLLERQEGRLVPTRAGGRYLHRVRPALAELEEATLQAQASREAGEPRGHLTLSVPATFGAMWLLPRLSSFARQHPQIVVNLSTKIGPVPLPSPTLDAAIMYVPGMRDPALWYQPILPLKVHPVCRPGLGGPRATLATLLETQAVLHQASTPEAWETYCEARGKGRLVARAGPRYALLSMGLEAAAAGLGVALLPDYVVADAVRRQALRRLDPEPFAIAGAYMFVCPRQHQHAPAIAAFSAWLAEEARAGEATGRAD